MTNLFSFCPCCFEAFVERMHCSRNLRIKRSCSGRRGDRRCKTRDRGSRTKCVIHQPETAVSVVGSDVFSRRVVEQDRGRTDRSRGREIHARMSSSIG